jgi:hypothetical protein
MPTAAEASAAPTQLAGELHAAVDVLSLEQTVSFTAYVRTVLPLDGFVFWVRADMLSPSALFNASAFGVPIGKPPSIATPAPTVTAKGSLHFSTQGYQDADQTIALKRVEFTSEQEVVALGTIAPNVLYIAMLPDGNRYAFAGRRSFYQQAGLWHYFGDAVYPPLESQLIEFPQQLDMYNVVVSNSLPIWLAMDLTNPPIGWPPGQAVPLFPSFLVPANLAPPYGAVDIPSSTTRGLQISAAFGPTLSRWQLTAERVDVTLYGYRNFNATDFVDYVVYYSRFTELFGLMNIPVIQDEKRTQLELAVIAQKKKVTFEINYYQSRMRDVARQLILSVIPSFDIDYSPIFRVQAGD